MKVEDNLMLEDWKREGWSSARDKRRTHRGQKIGV